MNIESLKFKGFRQLLMNIPLKYFEKYAALDAFDWNVLFSIVKYSVLY